MNHYIRPLIQKPLSDDDIRGIKEFMKLNPLQRMRYLTTFNSLIPCWSHYAERYHGEIRPLVIARFILLLNNTEPSDSNAEDVITASDILREYGIKLRSLE